MAPHPLASALARAEQRTETSLSDKQRETGRYEKGKMDWHGIPIAIENPKGSIRTGVGKDGKRWFCTLPVSYGEVRKSEGQDGDPVDVYVGPSHSSNKVFVIDQVDADTRRDDEHKCMLSFPDKASALDAYEKSFSDGKAKQRIGAVTELTVQEFRDWLRNGNTKVPMSKQKPDPSLELVRKYASGGRVGYAEGGDIPMPEEISRDLRRQMQAKALAGRELSPLEKAQLDFYMKDLPKRRELKSREIDELGVARSLLPDPAIMVRRPDAPDAGPDLRRRAQDMAMRGIEPDKRLLESYLERLPERRELKASEYDEGASAMRAAQEISPFIMGPVGRGVGSTLTRAVEYAAQNPFKTGLAAAGLGFLGSTADAGDKGTPKAAPDYQSLLKDLHTQRSTLEQRRTDADVDLQKARSEMKRQEKTGRGPLYTEAAENLSKAEAKYKGLTAELSSVTKMIEDTTEKTTPEYARKQAELDRKAAEDAAKAEANKTFREAHPYWNAALPALGLTGAVALPYLGKSVAQGVRNTPINRMNAAIADTDAAIAARDVGKISDLTPRLKAYQKDLAAGKMNPDPTMSESALGFLGSGLGGGVIGAEARMFPTQYDAAALPDDNPLKEEARKRQFDPMMYLEGMVPGALTSMGSYWKLPVRTAVPRAQDMEGILRKYGTTPEMAERALARSAGNIPTTPLRRVEPPMELRPQAPTDRYLSGPTATPPLPELAVPSPALSRASVPNLENATSKASDIIKEQTQRPVIIKQSAAGLHYPKGHEKAGQFVDHEFAYGTTAATKKKGKTQSLPEGEQGQKYLDVKSVPKKETKSFDPDDPINRGHKAGGVVGRALEAVRRFARGGQVDPDIELIRKYASGGAVITGALNGHTPGRADEVEGDVPSGSYVWPADVVAGRGQGNSLAGQEFLRRLEEGAMRQMGGRVMGYAKGGSPTRPVPVRVADGERITSPEIVAAIGGGSLERGLEICDRLVKKFRAEDINTLKNLPPPVRD